MVLCLELAQILSFFIDAHQVAPFEIYRIGKCEAAAAITVPSGENAEPSGAEMSSEENQLSKPEEKVSLVPFPCFVPLVLLQEVSLRMENLAVT